METLGIDIDGVLADYVPALIEHFNKTYGTMHLPEHITDYAMHKALSKDVEEWKDFVRKFEDEHIDKLPTIEGSEEAIRELSKEFRLVVITARPHWLRQKTEKWLKQNYGDVFLAVEFSKQSNNPNLPTKAEHCKRYGAVAHVEDAPHHALAVAEVSRVFLKDTSYNAGIAHPKIKRVRSWDEILSELSS